MFFKEVRWNTGMRVFHLQIMTVLTPMQMGVFLFMIAKYFRLVYPVVYKSLTINNLKVV